MKVNLPISLALGFFVSGSVYADGNIVGSVFNKSTSEPLDYATVVLVNHEAGVPLLIGITSKII